MEVAHVSGIQGMPTVWKAESHSEDIVPPTWKECQLSGGAETTEEWVLI